MSSVEDMYLFTLQQNIVDKLDKLDQNPNFCMVKTFHGAIGMHYSPQNLLIKTFRAPVMSQEVS